VLPTVPPVCVRVSGLLKLPPEVVESSKPVGAVTVIFAERPEPDAVKLCSEEAVPEQVEKAEREPVVDIVGITARVVINIIPSEVLTPATFI
jgi:hypothetical protein